MEESENDDLIVVIVEDDTISHVPTKDATPNYDFSSYESKGIGIENPMELLLTVIKEEVKDHELNNPQVWDEEGICAEEYYSEQTDSVAIDETNLSPGDYTKLFDLNDIKETKAYRELKRINQNWQDIQNQIDKCDESIKDFKIEQYSDEGFQCIEEELEDNLSLNSGENIEHKKKYNGSITDVKSEKYSEEELECIEEELEDDLSIKSVGIRKQKKENNECDENIVYIKSEQYSEEELEFIEEKLEDILSLKSGGNVKQKNGKHSSIKNNPEKNWPIKCSKKKKERKIYKKRELPQGWHSHVSDLREQFPDLEEDEDLLVQVLANIMKDVKAPPLPPEYFQEKDFQFECNICNALTDTLPAAGRHYQERHGPRYLICYACGIDFRSRTNLYKHEKICGAKDRKIVLKARAVFLGRKGQNRPYLKTTSLLNEPRKYPCTECSAVFTSKQSLDSHINKHLGRRPYRCDKCANAYTCPLAFRRHYVTHKPVQYICDVCKRNFKTKSNLITHLDTHLPAKKFGCPDCDRRYATKHALTVHVNRVHKNIPDPFPCKVCPKRYAKMSQLKDHMRKAHNLNIMSRNMFLKKLPTLSDEELIKAKVIMKLNDVNVTEMVPA